MDKSIAEIAGGLSEARRYVLTEQSDDFGWFAARLAERCDYRFTDTECANACRENAADGLMRLAPVFDEDEGTIMGSAYLVTKQGLAVSKHLNGE